MLTVVGYSLLLSTKAAQITMKTTWWVCFRFELGQQKGKQSTRGKANDQCINKGKKWGKDGVCCQIVSIWI